MAVWPPTDTTDIGRAKRMTIIDIIVFLIVLELELSFESDFQPVIGCFQGWRERGVQLSLRPVKCAGHMSEIGRLSFLRKVTLLPQEHVDCTFDSLDA